MGKKEKERRKKVQARNNRIRGDRKRKEKQLEEIFEKLRAEVKEKERMDETETQNITLNTDGFKQSSEIF